MKTDGLGGSLGRVEVTFFCGKAIMIEFILICMGTSYVHKLMNDQDSTWMSKVSGFRKELLPSLPKAQPTQSLKESPDPCLLVSLSELAPLMPEDFELILQGPGELISSLASCLCVVGCGLLPESCSCTLFTGPAVCCVVRNILYQQVILSFMGLSLPEKRLLQDMICCPSAVNKCHFKRTYDSIFGKEYMVFANII